MQNTAGSLELNKVELICVNPCVRVRAGACAWVLLCMYLYIYINVCVCFEEGFLLICHIYHNILYIRYSIMHCKANFFLFWDIFVSETNTMFLMQNVAKQCSNLPYFFLLLVFGTFLSLKLTQCFSCKMWQNNVLNCLGYGVFTCCVDPNPNP